MSRFKVISADSHVVEPGNLWTDYIDPTFQERAPRLERQGETDHFVCEGANIAPPFAFSVAGRDLNPPRTFDEGVYPAAYDPDARLEHMAVDGIDAEVVYPSVGLRMFALADIELKLACLEAYNRWAADFCRVHPDVIKGLAMLAIDDVERAVSEMQTAKKMGLSGAMVTLASDDPHLYASESLDPIWRTAEELEMPLSLHLLTNQGPLDLRSEIESALYHAYIQRSLTNMVFTGVFFRFPGLKVVSAENDAGWAPYFMERMDYLFADPRRQTYQDYPIKGKGMLPSEYVKRGVFFTFMRDASAVYVRDLVGTTNLMWASDYPHNDSTWPHSQAMIESLFGGVPEGPRRQMVADNAARLYGFE
ncbi:MAG: amidohydrolase family protein [Dehalococcoidia bacterium]